MCISGLESDHEKLVRVSGVNSGELQENEIHHFFHGGSEEQPAYRGCPFNKARLRLAA
jgi:hypothetical protein